LPGGDPFDAVLQKALAQKVPKLVATPTNKHILLLGDGGTAFGFAKIGMGLDKSVEHLPDLKKVDSAWTIHTLYASGESRLPYADFFVHLADGRCEAI